MTDGLKTSDLQAMAAKADSTDRRRELRLPCDPSTVTIEVADDEHPVRGEVVDVSRSGFFLRLSRQVSGGQLLRATFAHMIVLGKVRHCHANSAGTFDTGVEILDIEHAENPHA